MTCKVNLSEKITEAVNIKEILFGIIRFLEICAYSIIGIKSQNRVAFWSSPRNWRKTMNEIHNQEKIKLAAEYIMETEDPVKYIVDEHQKLHVGDKGVAITLLLSIASQSVLNSKGIQPKVSGESGKGKTHCCQVMAHLVPNEWMIEASLSDKVIYRLRLKAGSIISSDDVDLSPILEGIIKRATTNFQKETTYITLNKEHEVTKLPIPPRVVWWLTSIDNDQSVQLLNRQFAGDVDDSLEQDRNVLEFQMEQALTGRVDLPETEQVSICRQIIRDIKEQQFTVKIPFVKSIEWPYIGNRRNFDIFKDLVYGFAVLRYRQRETDETGALIATIEDFESAAKLYNSRARSQQSKTTDSENRLIDALIQAGYTATYEDLCSKLNLTQGRISQLIQGKGKGHDSGLLHKIPELSIDKTGQKDVVRLNKSYKQNIYEVKLKDMKEE